MVAKRNAEVGQLNGLAREVMRAEGRLGDSEIEIGGVGFAAGDQVITRINDHKAQISNRERWRIESVDLESGTVVLDGIDTPGRVCVDSVYLGRVTNYGDPALQHAYAATTYQAQGATVDRAYVMADPSMDRQELYVATSRSREETWLYATPEVQFEREEYAPRSPHLREGLEHIAEAAQRDGAQVAAHDFALRSRLGDLPSEELGRRREELAGPARNEAREQERREAIEKRIAEADQHLEGLARQAEQLGELPRKKRAEAEQRIEVSARSWERSAERLEAERAQLAPGGHEARAEVAVIDYLLAERGRLALAAVRLSPPAYIVNELGQRPTDPSKRAHWDRAMRGIERYREQRGIGDRDSALGTRPKPGAERARWERRQRELLRAQRALQLAQARTRSIEMGIGR